jgi:xanthosine utilization system XapX-like protein
LNNARADKEDGLRSRIERALPRPATGRLGVVSAYFLLAGVGGSLAVAGITAALVMRRLHWQTTPANPIVALVGAVVMTVGFFRTSQLLDQRRKAGAQLAAFCFAAPLVGYLTGSAPSRPTLIVAGAGLALVASVWRHLD